MYFHLSFGYNRQLTNLDFVTALEVATTEEALEVVIVVAEGSMGTEVVATAEVALAIVEEALVVAAVALEATAVVVEDSMVDTEEAWEAETA